MNEPIPKPESNVDNLHEQARHNLLLLLDLDVEQFDAGKEEFLRSRLAELSASATCEGISSFDGGFCGFVGPDNRVYAQAGGVGIRLDDDEPYNIALDELRTRYYEIRDKLPPERALLNASLMAAQRAEVKYFGNVFSGSGADYQREMLVGDYMDDVEDRSISEFKGIAKCAERAFVSNNILQVFGQEPSVEIGHLRMGDGADTLHAYLLVEDSEGGKRLFDPQNPTVMINQDGHITDIVPTIYPADALAPSDGSQPAAIVVMHRTIRVDEQGQRMIMETPYLYSPRVSISGLQ